MFWKLKTKIARQNDVKHIRELNGQIPCVGLKEKNAMLMSNMPGNGVKFKNSNINARIPPEKAIINKFL